MYNRSLKRSITDISYEAMEMFNNHDWPGNVRELQHAIESAMNIADDCETVLLPSHFPATIRRKITSNSAEAACSMSVPLPDGPLEQVLEKLELIVISHALKKNKWNVSITAKQLDIKRQSLQYRIRKYGLKRLQ
jgi:arginine utilization regulatory protein